VMKKKKLTRCKWLHIRLNESEYEKIHGFWKASTSRQLSDYARTLLLKKPVIFLYRNQSADDILSELIRLKNELNAVGNNFSQAVHLLYTLDRVPEIKAWILENDIIKQNLIIKTEEIRIKMTEIYEVWSQK
jgi:hypothetical protein